MSEDRRERPRVGETIEAEWEGRKVVGRVVDYRGIMHVDAPFSAVLRGAPFGPFHVVEIEQADGVRVVVNVPAEYDDPP